MARLDSARVVVEDRDGRSRREIHAGIKTEPLAQQGKLNFELKCIACHSIAGGDKIGPDLHQVTRRRTAEWIARWIKDPQPMQQSDPTGKQLLAKYKIPMPNQNATDAEIKGYVAYFKWATALVHTVSGGAANAPACR